MPTAVGQHTRTANVYSRLDRLRVDRGFIASKLVSGSGEGLVLDIVLGVVGAVVGGFVFNQFGAAGVTGFNIYSMVVAVVGAVLVLVIYHAVPADASPEFAGGPGSSGSPQATR